LYLSQLEQKLETFTLAPSLEIDQKGDKELNSIDWFKNVIGLPINRKKYQ